jgi:N-acetyl sugar amidotransferase
MDTTDPHITFDQHGYCNHCNNALKKLNEIYFIDPEKKAEKLNAVISKIKNEGKNKQYDCIIGLSGGVDSSFLAYKIVKDYRLRPLAVHLDNGWNSELAVKNIENLVNKLSIDLYTHVLDWEEFKDLQRAFLRASVIDLELLSDHAIGEALYEISKQFKLKYFLSGYNCQSETVMPTSWLYPYKMDSLNIKDIYKKNGGRFKLQTFKFLNFYEYLNYGRNQMELIPILNFMAYNKMKAITDLEKDMSWQNYGNKHEESIITKFYQGYILPKKFKVDKRKAHFSSLICSGQLTRDEALKELEKQILPDEKQMIEYFVKKIGFTKGEFEEIMKKPPVEHWEYRSFAKMKHRIAKIYKSLFK